MGVDARQFFGCNGYPITKIFQLTAGKAFPCQCSEYSEYIHRWHKNIRNSVADMCIFDGGKLAEEGIIFKASIQ